MHFFYVRARAAEDGPAPLALILTHGWPRSFVEMLPVAGRLADPARHGADPDDAFDVVIPSLPGFLHSGLPRGPFTRRGLAETWHELMTGILGYQRFGAFGGRHRRWGDAWLGALYPGQVAGVHVTTVVVTTDFTKRPPSVGEQAFLDALDAYDTGDQGYSEIMRTPAGHHRRRQHRWAIAALAMTARASRRAVQGRSGKML